MSVITEDKQLHDFSIGMISALIVMGHTSLDEQHRPKLHQGFVNAFEYVQSELGITDATPRMEMNTLHGTAADVDHILYFWRQQGYSNKIGTESINQFQIAEETAEQLLYSLPGDSITYLKAAAALLKHMEGPYVPTPH